MKYTLAITHYNRVDMLIESVSKVSGLVDEIVVQDDHSSFENQKRVVEAFKDIAKVYFNTKNIQMSRNKAEAISNASNKWVIILDSDNIIYPEYINAIPKHLDVKTIYLPSFAEPNFDYRHFSGKEISRETLHTFLGQKNFDSLLNTCNYLVNRDEYIKVYEYNPAMKATDTIWFAYLWLKAGNKFQVVKDMTYFHRVHKGSGFLADMAYNMYQAIKVKKLIMEL